MKTERIRPVRARHTTPRGLNSNQLLRGLPGNYLENQNQAAFS
jgi:hypothetical protein